MIRLNMTALMKKARSMGDESVEDIASRTGIGRATLYRLANGGEPSLPTLCKFRAVYGGRVDSLITEDPTTPGVAVPKQRTPRSRSRRAT
ncbi:helix-turn-helix domain-containing protein [Streptomyces sp. NPDC092369]|uniref:helix-turn-helix domain-containing protein n=1 Tax=Streptomyces sp. NPDC092369 TaxID=3366015 RepID=UPI003805A5B1